MVLFSVERVGGPNAGVRRSRNASRQMTEVAILEPAAGTMLVPAMAQRWKCRLSRRRQVEGGSVSNGERGAGFIECHHTKPPSQLQNGQKTKIGDLKLLCSNCHRMVHARRPWLTIEELRAILRPSA
jgi:HNH endonuclease